MIEAAPESIHPAASGRLVGHEAAKRRMLEAVSSGRLHHAWLLSGPRGIGKATLAYRFARFLLAYPERVGETVDNLAVPADHPVFHHVAAHAHPDLFVLEREIDPKTGRARAIINVEDVRKTIHFLSMTAAEGGWRVAIIDAADEMNANAANALLKILEEPPEKSILFLVAHAPGKLLPTMILFKGFNDFRSF